MGQALTKPFDGQQFEIKVLKPGHAWTFVICSLSIYIYTVITVLPFCQTLAICSYIYL